MGKPFFKSTKKHVANNARIVGEAVGLIGSYTMATAGIAAAAALPIIALQNHRILMLGVAACELAAMGPLYLGVLEQCDKAYEELGRTAQNIIESMDDDCFGEQETIIIEDPDVQTA